MAKGLSTAGAEAVDKPLVWPNLRDRAIPYNDIHCARVIIRHVRYVHQTLFPRAI